MTFIAHLFASIKNSKIRDRFFLFFFLARLRVLNDPDISNSTLNVFLGSDKDKRGGESNSSGIQRSIFPTIIACLV